MYQSGLHFTFEFITLLELKVNAISGSEFHIILLMMLENNDNSRGPFNALYPHEHINSKSPLHMIKIDNHD
jgi:hypothetical protein